MRTFASRDPSYNEKRDVRDAEVGQEGHSAAYFERCESARVFEWLFLVAKMKLHLSRLVAQARVLLATTV